MNRRYYFLHLPKTAGTSVSAWIEETRRFSVMPDHLWGALLVRPRSQLEHYDMFWGHFYRSLHSYLPFPVTPFVFLRNPIDRSISHYEHIRREPGHYFHDRVRRQGSFLAFLRDSVTRPMVRNFQVRALCNTLDPETISAVLGETRGPLALEREIETRDIGLDDSDALALAQDYLDRCCVVGISEMVDESIALLASEFEIATYHPPQRLNVGSGRHSDALTLKTDELTELMPLIADDWRLYKYGRAIFERQLGQLNSAFQR